LQTSCWVPSACSRQQRFPRLLGDPGVNGASVALPVDGYWHDLRLIVEYRERQHDKATPFFDKPDRLTVSGVHRGEQRRLYDERRGREILRMARPCWSEAWGPVGGRAWPPPPSVGDDRCALQALLSAAGVETG